MIAPIENGKLMESTSAASIANGEKKKSNSTVDKDQFLQLLVAQMKYQDPLEPTSNTEYISQYATFSELEQMQNMSASLELARASQLVGHTVVVKVVDSAGRTTTAQGNVDYIVYENNKAYLSINGELYSIDDLDMEADPNYLAAYTKAADFMNAYNKLPILPLLTLEHKDAVEALNKTYQEMTNYEKKFIDDDFVTGLKKYVDRIEALKAAEENNGDNKPDDVEKPGEGEDTGEVPDDSEDNEDEDGGEGSEPQA